MRCFHIADCVWNSCHLHISHSGQCHRLVWYVFCFNVVEFILAICYHLKRLRHFDDLHENATCIESSIRFPENDRMTDNTN